MLHHYASWNDLKKNQIIKEAGVWKYCTAGILYSIFDFPIISRLAQALVHWLLLASSMDQSRLWFPDKYESKLALWHALE